MWRVRRREGLWRIYQPDGRQWGAFTTLRAAYAGARRAAQ